MSQIAIFPGTFDPITSGHQDLIERAAKLFDQVIVAVAENNLKSPLFSFEQRIDLTRKALSACKNVQVKGFDNLLINFAHEHNAKVIVRGVRIAADFEYELQLSSMNRSMDPSVETIFLTPSVKYSFISSSLVKEIAQHAGDVSSFVDPEVVKALKEVKWH